MTSVVMIFRSIDRTWTDEDQQGLLPPEEGRIVQIRDGAHVVTDGPFGEAKEQLAGFYLVDVADDAHAQAIAARVSAAVGDRVELRGTLVSA